MQGKCGLFFTSYQGEAGLFRSGFQKLMIGLFAAGLMAVPILVGSYAVSILNLIFIAVIGAVSLNLLTGACGQISLGHGAFIGVGAYAAGQCTLHGVPFPLAILSGGLVTALVGMVFGVPSLRLKGIYLAIATLAAQLVLEYAFLHGGEITGGSNGLLLDPPRMFGFAFDTEARMYYLLFAFAGLSLLMVSNIMRGKYGRAFVAIRDFHLSAEINGVNLFRYKIVAFGTSSFLAGVAGGLWGHYTGYISAEQFNIGLSITYLAMVVIGGLGSVLGSVFGAVFLTLLPEALNILANGLSGWFPAVNQVVGAIQHGVFGLVLILFLVYEPEGLAHRWRLIKAYWKLYPFAH